MLPDFIANAGGVISASVEYHGGTESAAFAAIDAAVQGCLAGQFDAIVTAPIHKEALAAAGIPFALLVGRGVGREVQLQAAE